MTFLITGPQMNTAAVCAPILRALPDWFGIEAAIRQYEAEIDHLPTFLAVTETAAAGFLSLKLHNAFSAELYVMGVVPAMQRQGMGQALVREAQFWLRMQGVDYLQVKTLGESHPDAHYAATRAFYARMGFRPLEELKQIWDENNPCLIMVKRL